MTRDDNGSDSVVDRVYEQLKAMSVSFELKPGERLNEGEPAKRLGVSRTPLREALNRLNSEGFLRFPPGKGFFCRELRPGAAYWPAPRHHHLGDQGRLRS